MPTRGWHVHILHTTDCCRPARSKILGPGRSAYCGVAQPPACKQRPWMQSEHAGRWYNYDAANRVNSAAETGESISYRPLARSTQALRNASFGWVVWVASHISWTQYQVLCGGRIADAYAYIPTYLSVILRASWGEKEEKPFKLMSRVGLFEPNLKTNSRRRRIILLAVSYHITSNWSLLPQLQRSVPIPN